VANINRVILTGNLTADPELSTLPSGTSVCKLRLAVNRRYKDSSSGEWTEKPNYFDIKVWGAQGENCANYLSKGRAVAIDGRLEWSEWEAQDGGKRSKVEVVADTVQFLGSRGDGEQSAGGFRQTAELKPEPVETFAGGGGGGGGADDDIPF
jgi:single-strand DNA-binding protein